MGNKRWVAGPSWGRVDILDLPKIQGFDGYILNENTD